jgi:flagellar biogenesis protein FliO
MHKQSIRIHLPRLCPRPVRGLPRPMLRADPEPAVIPDREKLPLGTPDNTGSNPQNTNKINSGSWGLQTAMALGVVVLLIVLLRLFLRRLGGVAGAPAATGMIDVLGRTTIGPKTQVLFIKLNHRVIVAGQTPAGINTLASIDDPQEVADLLAQCKSKREQSITGSFQRLMAQVGGQDDANDLNDTRPANDEQLLHRTRGQLSGVLDRLRGMKKGGTND